MADEPIRDEGVTEIDDLPSDDPDRIAPDEGDGGREGGLR